MSEESKIGKTIRIRLPDDYKVEDRNKLAIDNKNLTTEEYGILLEAKLRYDACKIAEDLMRADRLADMLYMGYTPPTRWQRFKYRLQDLQQRCKDIWTIVSGGDIHDNCVY